MEKDDFYLDIYKLCRNGGDSLKKKNVQEKSVRVWNKKDRYNYKSIWHISRNKEQSLLMSEWQTEDKGYFQKQM